MEKFGNFTTNSNEPELIKITRKIISRLHEKLMLRKTGFTVGGSKKIKEIVIKESKILKGGADNSNDDWVNLSEEEIYDVKKQSEFEELKKASEQIKNWEKKYKNKEWSLV